MARADYEAAKILYQDGDFQSALQKLRAAHEASRDPRLLWNMAACEKNLRHYSEALGLVERYLSEGAAVVTAEDRAAADALVEAVRGFVADVTVTVSQPGAAIEVDGAALGKSPLPGPVRLDMGQRTFRFTLPGYQELLLKQELPGGRAVGVTAQLVEERHEGKVRIVAGPKDVISVDGKVVGTGVWEGVLPSGPHAVHVTAQGKRPYRTDALVKDAEVTALHVNLEDEARPAAAAGVPAWVWVAGGAAVVGAGVGAYFLFGKDEDPGYRDPQVGTWGAIDL